MSARPNQWQGWVGVAVALLGILWVVARAPASSLPVMDTERQLERARLNVVKRPSWPYVWMELAALLAKQGHYGDELTHALRRSVHLGPQESTLEFQRAVLALEHMGAPLPIAAANMLRGSLRAERLRHSALVQAYVVVNHLDRAYCKLPDLTKTELHWCATLPHIRKNCRYRLMDALVQKQCDAMDAYSRNMLSNWRAAMMVGYGAVK